MAHTIEYTCDVCWRPVTEVFGVLRVSIRGQQEPDVNAELELCSLDCLARYIDKRRVKP